MIIDTESEEGKALVAFAKLGACFLAGRPGYDENVWAFAETLGLGDSSWTCTALAKLPEGI